MEEARVEAICSGDSMMVSYPVGSVIKYEMIHMYCCTAPRLGNGKRSDEPHAFDSWLWLRDRCIKHKVQISQKRMKAKGPVSWAHWNNVPLSYSRVNVLINDKWVDIVAEAMEKGIVNIRKPLTGQENNKALNELEKCVNRAKQHKLGLWGNKPRVREIGCTRNGSELCDEGPASVYVWSVEPQGVMRVYHPGRSCMLKIVIAGCKGVDEATHQGLALLELRDMLVCRFMHMKIQVVFCMYINNGVFIARILGGGEVAGRTLLRRGLVQLDYRAIKYVSDIDTYFKNEIAARKERQCIWKNELFDEATLALPDLHGVCTELVNSAILRVQVDDKHMFIKMSCVDITYYANSPDSKDLEGRAVREELRRLVLGKALVVKQRHGFSSFSYGLVYCGDRCINEEILSLGLGKLVDPVVGSTPPNRKKMEVCEKRAKSAGLGFRGQPTDERELINLLPKCNDSIAADFGLKYKGKTISVVIEEVVDAIQYKAYCPSLNAWLRVGVNMVRLPSDKDIVKQGVKFARMNYLLCEANLTICRYHEVSRKMFCDCDVTLRDGTVTGLAHHLTSHGMVTVCTRADGDPIDASLWDLQEVAKEEKLGVWNEAAMEPDLDGEEGGEEDDGDDNLDDDGAGVEPVAVPRYTVPQLRRLTLGEIWRVHIIDVIDVVTYNVQFIDDASNNLHEYLMAFDSRDHVDHPTPESCVVVRLPRELPQRNIEFGRAVINSVNQRTSTVTVMLTDWGMRSVDIPFADVFELPDEFAKIELQSMIVGHSNCVPIANDEKNMNLVKGMYGMALYMHLVYVASDKPMVVFADGTDIEKLGLLGQYLISNNVVAFKDAPVPDSMKWIVDKMRSSS